MDDQRAIPSPAPDDGPLPSDGQGASGNGGTPSPVTNGAPEGGARSRRLREVAAVFLKLGVIGFGGPAAHIGLMENELVRRRGWLTHEKFADLLAATNLIPGPNSTEMAIYVGHLRAGGPGLVVAGACFILPAMLIVLAIAWGYDRYGELPQVGGLLYGVKPVIIAVILQALWGLTRKAVKSPFHLAVGAVAAGMSFWGWNELVLLLGAGLVGMAAHVIRPPRSPGAAASMVALPPIGLATAKPFLLGAASGSAGLGAAVGAATPFGLGPLFLFFLKVGAVLYGSGYVLLAFLRSDLVERWQWLTEAELLDAVAVGQITPGPLFTTATFVGYVLGGLPAALVATLGIFLPAFFFVAISGPLIPRLRRSPWAGAFLDGVIVASLALMAVVTWHLGRAALLDVPTVLLALASAVLLLRFRVNSAWLVLGGAVVGLALAGMGVVS